MNRIALRTLICMAIVLVVGAAILAGPHLQQPCAPGEGGIRIGGLLMAGCR